MNEIENICRTASLLEKSGEASWLATVVRVRGSSYRRAGARLLFSSNGVQAGSVSAGCLEDELVRTGSWHAADRAVLRVFEAELDEDQAPSGSGCGGSIDVLVEPVSGGCSDALRFVQRALEAQQRVAIATVISGHEGDAALGARVLCSNRESFSAGCNLGLEEQLSRLAGEAMEWPAQRALVVRRPNLAVLLEVLEPAPRLFVFGAGPDALPLASVASQLGWDVTVVSRRDRPAVRERFAKFCRYLASEPRLAVRMLNQSVRALGVVMSHDYAQDREVLKELLASRARYIGVLGPLRRTQRLLADIECAGGSDAVAALQRIRAPAGLALGAETPAEIALSIVAEAQAALTQTSAVELSSQAGPIHRVAPPRELYLAHAEGAE